jgi:hypothetical protein
LSAAITGLDAMGCHSQLAVGKYGCGEALAGLGEDDAQAGSGKD